MSLSRRIDDLEDHHLTHKEAVIIWMREAHEFDSLLTYGRWLLEQPEDAYSTHPDAQAGGGCRPGSEQRQT